MHYHIPTLLPTRAFQDPLHHSNSSGGLRSRRRLFNAGLILPLVATIFALIHPALGNARNIKVLAIRHGESMNNILSQSWNPARWAAATVSQRNKIKKAGTVATNPVLSPRGRALARLKHNLLFPQAGGNATGIFSGEEAYSAVLVSPLNRTIQTALVLFGTELYKPNGRTGVPTPLIPMPAISEHRKGRSEDGSRHQSSLELFSYELDQLVTKQNLPEAARNSDNFSQWKADFETSLGACCGRDDWWPRGDQLDASDKETADSLQNRQQALEAKLTELSADHDKVVMVSHGTFIRTLLHGINELTARQWHLQNLAMVEVIFDTATKKWQIPDCWDPATQEVTTNRALCYDRVPGA